MPRQPTTRDRSATRTTSLSAKLVAVLSSALLVGVAPPAQASGAKGRGHSDKGAIKILTRVIGHQFEELNTCLDAYDEHTCFDQLQDSVGIGWSRIAGLGFAIAAIFKFKAHCENPESRLCPGDDIALMVQCLADGEEEPPVCIDTLDPSVQELAQQLGAYRAVRPYCGEPGALCQRFADWPSSWPWPFVEPPRPTP